MQSYDPLSLITIFIAFVSGIIIPIVLKKRTQKQITYEIISNSPVLNISDEVKNKVNAMYGTNRSVNELYQVVLKVTNTGRDLISITDYLTSMPITFSFGQNVEVLESVPNTKTSIKKMLVINKISQKVTIEPIELIKNESFLLFILLSGKCTEIKDETRLPYVKKIFKGTVPVKLSVKNAIITAIALSLSAMIAFIITSYITLPFSQPSCPCNALNAFFSLETYLTAVIISLLIAVFYMIIIFSKVTVYGIKGKISNEHICVLHYKKINSRALFSFLFLSLIYFTLLTINFMVEASFFYNQSDFYWRAYQSNLLGCIIAMLILIISYFILKRLLPLKITVF